MTFLNPSLLPFSYLSHLAIAPTLLLLSRQWNIDADQMTSVVSFRKSLSVPPHCFSHYFSPILHLHNASILYLWWLVGSVFGIISLSLFLRILFFRFSLNYLYFLFSFHIFFCYRNMKTKRTAQTTTWVKVAWVLVACQYNHTTWVHAHVFAHFGWIMSPNFQSLQNSE